MIGVTYVIVFAETYCVSVSFNWLNSVCYLEYIHKLGQMLNTTELYKSPSTLALLLIYDLWIFFASY